MPRKKNISAPGTRKYGTKTHYSEQTLEEALEKIRSCKLSQRSASKKYNIPRSTLKYKLKDQHLKPVGKPLALEVYEEDILISHIMTLADLGMPIGLHDVRAMIKKYLDSQGRTIKQFKDNMPGWEWGRNFLSRHPDIKPRVAHNISRKRAQVNKELIDTFFDHFEKEIVDIHPANVYNFDETGFHDNPKKSKLLFRRQCRNPEIIKNSTKSCFTTVFCGNAAGEMLPPFIIYKAKQKWSDWLDGAPQGTRMAVTKSGWIDLETFDEWFESQVLPILKKKEGQKILIGDNLSSHISIKTLRLCEENNIKYICLVPNSTHLLQPLDVAYFSSLKSNWRSVLNDWRNTRRGKVANVLPKSVFASLLRKTLELGEKSVKNNLIAGFKATGLYPCDRTIPLNKLPHYGKSIEEITQNVGESFKSYIDELRTSDLGVTQKKRFQIPVISGKSVSVEEVQKYKEQREESSSNKANKKRKPTAPKKPIPKKKKTENELQSSTRSISTPESTLPDSIQTDKDSDTLIRKKTRTPDKNQNVENIENLSPNIQVPQERRDNFGEIAVEDEFLLEDYEVVDGILELQNVHNNLKSVDRYCVVNYEGILFPGRITKSNHPNYKISIMQKAINGWVWPRNSSEIVSVTNNNIIRVLNESQIIRKSNYFEIDDDFLSLEWGD